MSNAIAPKVTILRYPTEEDWARCKYLAAKTAGYNKIKHLPDAKWKKQMLASRHSPIRTLMYTIEIETESWISVHLVRHKIGVEHYVSTQRNDRQIKYDENYDRRESPQKTPVHHILDINADALITMANKRLCGMAAEDTRTVMKAIRTEVLKVSPELEEFLVPTCMLYGCHERNPCTFSRHELLGDSED